MNTTIQLPGHSSGKKMRRLPAVVTFESDTLAKKAVVGLQHFLRLSFEELERGRDSESVLVSSYEQLIREHAWTLRAPNVRVIALSDTRFKDPRVDGIVYAYLPPDTPPALVERQIENAVDHIHLLATRREINERLAGATHEIHELNFIGSSLSAEHDPEKVLEMILTKAREITTSDAGSLYLVDEPKPDPAAPTAAPTPQFLRFKLAQNDSVDVPFRELQIEINSESIAGYVALTGDGVNLDDAYLLPPGVPYQINRKFDEESGYRTKSILAVPLRTPKGEVVGVLQLINAKRDRTAKLDTEENVEAQVTAFSFRQQELVTSLASQAAVALENSRLYGSIHRLFEGFVRASVIAIEARDPTTSGHSFRVADLTTALADAVDRTSSGPCAKLRFTHEQMRELRYASLLHDFGKVGVQEDVLRKSKKLYPYHMELIQRRFQFAKRTVEAALLREQLQFLMEHGPDGYRQAQAEFQRRLREELAKLDFDLSLIAEANEPTILPDSSCGRLASLTSRTCEDVDGTELRLLAPDEVRVLSIAQGSLNEEERQQIEAHVVHTFNFLSQIPWTKELSAIPEIARGHHEKLNGSGYPYKLNAPQIPVQTRIMTISDIFDALAAGDRPYKEGVSPERALEILTMSVRDGELDADLFSIFLEAKIYERWRLAD